jgi:hypothetical protein
MVNPKAIIPKTAKPIPKVSSLFLEDFLAIYLRLTDLFLPVNNPLEA